MSEKNEKQLTLDQQELQKEFVATYGLSPENISFEGEKPEPIFDFEALSVLIQKLTTFKSVDVSQVSFNTADQSAEAICAIFTTDDRTVTVSDFAEIGESMPDGKKIESGLQAKRLARARALRSGIRTAGVNLLRAHRQYLATGEISESAPIDPRAARVKEVHAIAGEIGFIKGSDKFEYQKHLSEMFDGRTSTKDLNDIELHKFVVSLRAIRRVQQATIAADPKAA